jgi:DNA-binding CsgD family transcriptional regulator
MAVKGRSNYQSVRARIHEEILEASVPSQRLVQIIELIDVCRVGNGLEAIEEVCDRLAEVLNTDAALELRRDCCRACDRVAISTNDVDYPPTEASRDLELCIDDTSTGKCDSQTLAINGRERVHLAVSSRCLRICYFSGQGRTGICFICTPKRVLQDIGHYLPLVYLLPHIYAMHRRILDQSENVAGRSAISPCPSERLTQREADVLRWIAVGKTNWEIGRILRLSERTVKFHLSNAFSKLNAVNRAQAVLKARETGALTPLIEDVAKRGARARQHPGAGHTSHD